MVQIIPRAQNFVDRLGSAPEDVGKSMGIMLSGNIQNEKKLKEDRAKQDAIKRLGLDPAVLSLPESAQAEYFKSVFARDKPLNELQMAQKGLAEAKTKQAEGVTSLFGNLGKNIQKPDVGNALQGKNEISNNQQISSPLENMNETDLEFLSGFAGQPGPEGIIGNIAANQLKNIEKKQTKKEQISAERRKEVAPIKKEIVDRAQSARLGIENKQHLLELIEKGDINDPTYAALAESLPLNLGKRLLSPDTVEYKAGLIEEFGDLKRLFPGQIRVKEIEILQEKLADLYLDDVQKKQILNSRINALKADIIREEAAADMEEEGKDLGILQYRKELEKRAKPKLDALFNSILDEQKSIIQNAENKKAIPLDPSDAEDMQIAQQIMIEAGGDRNKARELAKKKGYTF